MLAHPCPHWEIRGAPAELGPLTKEGVRDWCLPPKADASSLCQWPFPAPLSPLESCISPVLIPTHGPPIPSLPGRVALQTPSKQHRGLQTPAHNPPGRGLCLVLGSPHSSTGSLHQPSKPQANFPRECSIIPADSTSQLPVITQISSRSLLTFVQRL